MLSGSDVCAFELQENAAKHGDDASHLQSYLIKDTTERYVQYSMAPDAAISPYVSVGDDMMMSDEWDVYWRDSSYESVNQPVRGNAWAGVKVKLTKMLNLDLDTNTRHIRSAVSLSPKTKVKFRVKLRSIKADLVYRY